jgi:EAL domain-containing protein (putative c-di-GMP-specific phosphodiesterase class I)
MQSIAEWVENGETLEALAKMGVDYVQGYAIARPLSPDTLLAAENIDSVILDEHMRDLVRGISSPQTATDFWDQHHNLPPTDWH